MPGRDRGAQWTDGTGRMKPRRARFELPRRLANPTLHFNAFDQRGENLATRCAVCLRQR